MTPDPSTCMEGIAKSSRVPRLTNAQYDNTIQDLLFLDVTPSTMLAPDSNGSVDQRSWDAYVGSAERLATQAMTTPAARSRIVTCTPSGDGAACARTVITSFGRRAFRRPLTSAEIQRFEALYADRMDLTETGSFDDGVELILEAFLQSPSFLMRPEISTNRNDGRIPLSDHEVAVRLSYMLWNSTPDDALLDVADAGGLSSDADIRAQAERMIGANRARANVIAFHRLWLGIDGSDAARWNDIVRDPGRFPDFDSSMVPLLAEETTRFVEHVVFELDGGFQTMLTSNVAFVNQEIAPLYDLDPASYGAELEPVSLDASRRGGLFTRVGFLASHSMYDRTSPILRGAYIQKHILCANLGTPPPGAEMTPLPPPDPSLVTTRDRVTAQTGTPACASCHRDRINPIGFSLENFDAIGQWRDLDNGATIDASGAAPIGSEVAAFDGASEMSALVATAPAAHVCYAVQWVEYAYGRTKNSQDRCVADTLAGRLADPTYSIQDLLVDLTQTEAFRNRSSEEGP